MADVSVLKDQLREMKDQLSKATIFTDILLSELNQDDDLLHLY
jgi:hypothetical protein